MADVYAEAAALIVDCGANIGLSARYFATEYHEVRIVALEPDIRNVHLQERNARTSRTLR
jgi:FkbM family methyltransferase